MAEDVDDLVLLFMGDTQYHFPCTSSNKECKAHSAEFRKENDLNMNCLRKSANGLAAIQVQTVQDECAIMESRFANEVQRKALFDLNRRLSPKPSGLILNGDLTNFGHSHQLNLFKTEWLTMPFPIYAGLGNHDYQNNVDDCVANQCVNNMLSWFANEYAPIMNLTIDLERSNMLWKTIYDGSFAYSKDLCSQNKASCVHSIQLHNRPDYATSAGSLDLWKVRASLQWLRHDLDRIQNKTWPVLINLHNHELTDTKDRLKVELEAWLNNKDNEDIIRRAFVLFAHVHDNHSLSVRCIGGVTVPFLYVGSVPKNRYTLIKFKPMSAEIYFMKANPDGTNTITAIREFEWKPC
ncbi:unnamed protein product [Bursaphelenchus okinawaensis]|uniref:Calcineurin-like phosphoesterase domain-containing protein n=1 Tax=Bursaphelenchus okinawaensis TaxID=465554 RepID=A0A811KRS3_9BILA|nr:unnamed protein product [Bursaphelenchus okinawaensis]CAG9109474.1 unnamed protein product [Bursaphelenchus okinawaensis]